MRTLEFVVADALVPTDFAPEVLRDLSLPHLCVLAAHALDGLPHPDETAQTRAEVPLLTTWQGWLLRHQVPANLATWWARALDFEVPPATPWLWMLEPAHFQVGHDRVMLGDPRSLTLSGDESKKLAEAARPILSEAGWTLFAISPERWFVARTDAQPLYGPALECGVGRNVALWMPHGEPAAALGWRRVVNEIQMTWFIHPVNETREAAGLSVINGAWLSGTGQPDVPHLPFAKVVSGLKFLRNAHTEANAATDLETFDGLIEPARSQDWSAWRNAVQALDLRAGELLGTLRDGTYDTLECALTGETGVRCWRVRRTDLWKFWRRGHAAELFAEST